MYVRPWNGGRGRKRGIVTGIIGRCGNKIHRRAIVVFTYELLNVLCAQHINVWVGAVHSKTCLYLPNKGNVENRYEKLFVQPHMKTFD